MAQGHRRSDAVTPTVVFAGLVGAITWNLSTWYFGLPSSSSHALIGGVVGAAFVAEGAAAVDGTACVGKVIVPALIAPIARLRRRRGSRSSRLHGSSAVCGPARSTADTGSGSSSSGGMLALAHGTNDAQKTMGIITLALIAHGNISSDNFHVPDWVVVSSATAIALGTYIGGWRIIRTMGSRIIKMDTAQGFSAQGAGAAVILAASHFGFPLSTTQVISGGVMGAGAAKRLSAVRWGVAGQHRPRLGADAPGGRRRSAALAYGISRIFGTGALGPLVVSISILGVVLAFLGRRMARGQVLTADT